CKMGPSSRASSFATTSAGSGDRSFEEGPTSYGIRQNLGIPRRGNGGRDRTPGMQWHKDYDDDSMREPRVLMIDYVRKNPEETAGTRKVIAQELHNIESLEAVYRDHGRGEESTLRVFHVQNCHWAMSFLSHKFHFRDHDKLVGLPGFMEWLSQKKTPRRAGKPLMVGKTWRTTWDPWRGIAKCAFGLDYMKHYSCENLRRPLGKASKVLGMMGYDENDNPFHRYDVFSQRVSVYVQFTSPSLSHPDPDMVSPYEGREVDGKPLEKTYDNGNTIIVFDTSDTGSIYDTLIAARGEWESRWRRLPFYLTHDHPEDDKNMTLDCMKIITQDIFKSIVDSWDALLDASWEHVSILEEKIYEQPADESRAPELWKNSAHWLKYEKLMFYHIDCVNDMQKALVAIDGDLSDGGEWLKEIPEDFERLKKLIQEDLVNRTNNLSDLMYKSVGIRDSRESLQLGSSMWRLSWITFVFLPLTFLCGFFGMNVDVFSKDPPIKYYFISGVPFMTLVFLSWYLLKHSFASYRQTPYQRGLYEAFFIELNNQRPDIWSRQGPREHIEPVTFSSRVKWWFMTHWMTGLITSARAPSTDFDNTHIGAWNRVKRHLTQRWINQIELPWPTDDKAEMGTINSPNKEAASPLPIMATLSYVAPDEAVPGVVTETMNTTGLVGGAIVSEVVCRNLLDRDRNDVISEGRSSGVIVEERREGRAETEVGKEGKVT
ncbi:hypothetical protein RUND412_000753, partial [Rhizina undulata]